MTAQDTEQNQLPVAQIWREAYGFAFSVPLRVLLTALLLLHHPSHVPLCSCSVLVLRTGSGGGSRFQEVSGSTSS